MTLQVSMRPPSVFAAVVAAALILPALPTAAAPAPDARPTTSVRYTDLDLGRTADAREMIHRLHAAAVAVCDEATGDAQDRLEGFAVRGRCITETLDASVRRLNVVSVSALYRGDGESLRVARR